jgi:hypothetical protein
VRFRKRPVEIEAVQLTWKSWSEVCEFLGGILSPTNPARYTNAPSDACGEVGPFIELTIPTLEGNHIAKHGDWIIRGVKGEFYPCKPDIFAATYDDAAAPQVEAVDVRLDVPAFALGKPITIRCRKDSTVAELLALVAPALGRTSERIEVRDRRGRLLHPAEPVTAALDVPLYLAPPAGHGG